MARGVMTGRGRGEISTNNAERITGGEISPLEFVCPHCGKTEETDFYNTTYYGYTHDEDKQHLLTRCPENNKPTIIWMSRKGFRNNLWIQQFAQYKVAEEDGVERPPKYMTDPGFLKAWERHKGLDKVVPRYELTDMQRKEVEFLGHLLDRISEEVEEDGSVLDTRIHDELAGDMPDMTMPLRWDEEV